MADERVLARGGVERIGSKEGRCFVDVGGKKHEAVLEVKDHAVAVKLCLKQLAEHRCLESPRELAAIGFKTVHADAMTGVRRVNRAVLECMEAYADVAPAHNPPYVQAMRLLAKELPDLPLVAAFETLFHTDISSAERVYAVPLKWQEYGIQRYGFHGASHAYIAQRTAQLLNKPDAKIISCHLGGSSSLCAIRDGKSAATSMGMSPQSGLPQNNRVGDFDPFAIPVVMRATGNTLEQVLDDLANRSGLLGLSGYNDLRDIEKAAKQGNEDAELAIAVYVTSIRHYLGAYLLQLDGADAIVFTGGIGENSPSIRANVCANLDWLGIHLDEHSNKTANGEMPIHAANSRVQLWIMPTNEELIVARQAKKLLAGERGA
jgi:acetate kinase